MEKRKKKDKTSRLQNPVKTSLSQSWATVGHQRKPLSSKTSKSGKTPKPQCPQKMEPPSRYKLDPMVHHLKYGLFPKKTKTNRGYSHVLSSNPSAFITSPSEVKKNRLNSPIHPRKVSQFELKRLETNLPATAKTSTIQKFMKNKPETGKVSDYPTFVFRPLEHRNLRSLTVSASTHLDIKPKPQRWPLISPTQV